jgi:hypothetical protein
VNHRILTHTDPLKYPPDFNETKIERETPPSHLTEKEISEDEVIVP